MSEAVKKKPSLVNRIMQYASGKKPLYIASVTFAALGVFCSIMPYYYIGRMVQLLLAGDHVMQDYTLYLVLTAVFWTLRILFHAISTSCSHIATFHVLGNVRKVLVAKLTRVPLGSVQSMPSGSLKNIMVERVDSIETILAHILPEVTANVAAPLFLFVYLCTINWKLALASLITLVLGMAAMMSMSDTGKQWANAVEKTKILNDTAVEYINGIEVIKAFGKADSSYEKFQKAAYDGAYCYIEWMRTSISAFTAAFVVTPATMLAVLPIGGAMWLHGSITTPDLVMVIILASGLITPLISIMSYRDDIVKAQTIFDEVESILEMDEMQRPDTSVAEPADGTVVLEDVHFGYSEDKEILHGVSLTAASGTVNALVGPSGSGKSTIARLIASLWDVSSGTVKLGGVDIRNLSAEDFNRRVAYVSQDNFLFNTSIRENIRMGNPAASDEEVEAAAKACGCHDFILGLPKGYDTVAGTAGGHLSGGERQRISIARAMLKNADVVILDEATAYTDPENEALIQRSIAKVVQGKTLLVIAHRLSTITDADQIIVVNNGAIDSTGTHEKLLAQGGLYADMWKAHVSARDTAEAFDVPASAGKEVL